MKLIPNSKFILFLFLFLSTFHKATSQDKISTGAPFPHVKSTKEFFFSGDGEMLAVKSKLNEVWIQKFDVNKLCEISNNAYTDIPKWAVIEDALKFNGKYYLFYSLWDSKMSKEQLFYREIDYSTGKLKNQSILISSFPKKIAGWINLPFSNYYDPKLQITTNKFNFEESFNGEYLLIKYKVKPSVRNDRVNHDIIGLVVLSEEMNLSWKKEITLPYVEKKIKNLDYSIDSFGNAYILSVIFDQLNIKKTKILESGKGFHLELMKLSKNNSSQVFKLPLESIPINEIILFEGADNEMICSGFYGQLKDIKYTTGVFSMRLDQNMEIQKIVCLDFPIDVLNSHNSTKNQDKNEKMRQENKPIGIDHLKLNDQVILSDGSILLIGEKQAVKTKISYSNGSEISKTTYYYDEIILIKLSPFGEVSWIKKLPKRQYRNNDTHSDTGPGTMPYKYIFGPKNTHQFYYLDHLSNLNLPEDQEPRRYNDRCTGYLFSYVIDNLTGETQKKSILEQNNANGINIYKFDPQDIVHFDDFIIFSVYKKKKEDILIKFELD